jgi:hypothetical protein
MGGFFLGCYLVVIVGGGCCGWRIRVDVSILWGVVGAGLWLTNTGRFLVGIILYGGVTAVVILG